jgi:hypothetical protein
LATKKLPKEVTLVREHKLPKLATENSKSISFSQLYMFTRCPHQWYLTYLKKLAPYSASIHATFGTALHETVQNWLEVLFNKTVKEANELDLPGILLDRMKKTYKKERFLNNNTDYSTPEQLNEFYQDGLEILNFLTKKRQGYFSTKNTYLVGVEIPLLYPLRDNVSFKGYIDLVFYNTMSESYKIIDIKTSTSGWNDYAKKDEVKVSQIILYKEFFAKQFNTDVEKIQVEYYIVRRKVPEISEFPIKRLQVFIPASGKVKRNKAVKEIDNFLQETLLPDNTFNGDKTYEKRPSKSNCAFCPFKGNKHLCPESI